MRDTSLTPKERGQLVREWASGKRGTSWTAADREEFLAGSRGGGADRKAFEAMQAKIRAQTGRTPTLLTGERPLLNQQSLLG